LLWLFYHYVYPFMVQKNFPPNVPLLIPYFLCFIKTPFGHDFMKAVNSHRDFGGACCFHLQVFLRIAPFLSLSCLTCPILCYPKFLFTHISLAHPDIHPPTAHPPTAHPPTHLSPYRQYTIAHPKTYTEISSYG
jgi:hypothetical protein